MPDLPSLSRPLADKQLARHKKIKNIHEIDKKCTGLELLTAPLTQIWRVGTEEVRGTIAITC